MTGDCDCPRFNPLVGIFRHTLIAVPRRRLLHVLRVFVVVVRRVSSAASA